VLIYVWWSRSAPKREPLAPIGPQDRDSRARSIANTFQTAHLPLAELRHPTKQHLTATEAFDFLPDSELWAHEYDFVRFGEDPIDRGNVSGHFLAHAVPDDLRTDWICHCSTGWPESSRSWSSTSSSYLPRLERFTRGWKATRILLTARRLDRWEIHWEKVRRWNKRRRGECHCDCWLPLNFLLTSRSCSVDIRFPMDSRLRDCLCSTDQPRIRCFLRLWYDGRGWRYWSWDSSQTGCSEEEEQGSVLCTSAAGFVAKEAKAKSEWNPSSFDAD